MKNLFLLSLVCCGLLLIVSSSTQLRKSNQLSLDAQNEEAGDLHRIVLKKTFASKEQKRQSIQLLSTAHSYRYNKNEYSSHKDFLFSQKESETLYTSSSAHTVKLYNFKNVQYTGPLSFGKQSDHFDVIYDTGSANIWINSAHCKDEGCRNHKQYDSRRSSTFKSEGLDLDVQFGTGELVGKFGKDKVFIGDIEIENQEFVEIFEERGQVFADSHFDGIVGLAFPSMAAYNKNTLFESLMEQKKVKKNMFAFYMSPHDGKTDSEITVGGPDPSKYTGQLTYHKVLKDYYWLVGADNILVGGKDVGLCNGGCYVVADTGTSLITGPSESIFTLLDHVQVDSGCSNVKELPVLTFVLDGKHYDLSGSEYVLQDNDGKQETVEAAQKDIEMNKSTSSCALAFMALDIPNDDDGFKYEKAWILGDTFLQKYYSVYDRDNKSVGFARSKQ